MNGAHNDYGIRCEKHFREVFLPRCPACQSLTTEYLTLHIAGVLADAS